MRFAMMQLKYVMSIIAKHYRLEPTYGADLDLDLQFPLGILQPERPVRTVAHRR
jgi:hypothetical protein